MPIEIKYSDSGTGTIVTGSGKITDEEYISFYRKHLSKDGESLHKYKYNLTDWSDVANVEISIDAITEIAFLSKEAAEIDPGCVTAIVATKELLFGLSRMWETQSSNSESTVRVFWDRAAAEDWIRQKVEEKHGISDLAFD